MRSCARAPSPPASVRHCDPPVAFRQHQPSRKCSLQPPPCPMRCLSFPKCHAQTLSFTSRPHSVLSHRNARPSNFYPRSQVVIQGLGLHAGREFSGIQLSLFIKRRKGYLGYNVLLPSVLVTALGATAWAPPTCDANARLANVLIMALTLIAFKLSLSEVVPKARELQRGGGEDAGLQTGRQAARWRRVVVAARFSRQLSRLSSSLLLLEVRLSLHPH